MTDPYACPKCGGINGTGHVRHVPIEPITNKELKEQIYKIFFDKSTVDGVRIIHEDVWPIDELVTLITARDEKLIERIQKAMFSAKTELEDDECLHYNEGLRDAIQLIREGEDE